MMQTTPATSAKSILLVEDDDAMREVLTLLIEMETPYPTRVFQNAREVLQQIDELKTTLPSLFLFDYALPMMTGVELYHHLHSMTEFSHIPVLFITARPLDLLDPQVNIQHLPTLLKPFETDDLVQQIETLIA
ncbi:MAG TPA: response regulator [Ktedonobacteraceae bacterium]|jgi:CheY-like chemotaxis protein|nr:response regulator [Ktedonobacteraceae bacterium]